jgi:two-component system, NarL family, sensor histidine kinase YdfH
MIKKKNFLSRWFGDDSNYVRPFFLFLSFVMVGIYIFSVTNSPALHTVWKIVVFALLMVLHIGLYWLSPWVFDHQRWLGLYLIIQISIAFSLGMMSGITGVVFGLYPGLIGLIIGVPFRRMWKFLSILGVLAASALNFTLVTGMENLLWWSLGTIPVIIFTSMYVIMYLRQAEAREQAQALLKDLEIANRQLSDYAAQVEDLTLATERQRMARELHDTLSQGLAGLILQLEAVDAYLQGNNYDRSRTILQESMERARATLAESRQAIDNLRRPLERDLVVAIWQEVENFNKETGIPCEPELTTLPELPEVVVDTAIRVISEGLTNVARHARAKEVTLQVACKENELGIRICDDGVGFDPESIQAGHYGLVGMRERVRLAGGSLQVESAVEKGTCVSIRLPLKGGGA